MKTLIYLLIILAAIVFLGCDQTSAKQQPKQPAIKPLQKETEELNELHKSTERRCSDMKTDTLPSDIAGINLVIMYCPYTPDDYFAEHESGVPLDDKYATDRGIDKGQVYVQCEEERRHDYRIPHQKIINIVRIKYDMTVYDKTDYIFTRDTIFEVYTSASNASIFINSDVKFIRNNIRFLNKKRPLESNTTECNKFNDYLFAHVLAFCLKNKIRTR